MKNYNKLILLILLISIIMPATTLAKESVYSDECMKECDSYFINDYTIKEEVRDIIVPFNTIEVKDEKRIKGSEKVLTEGIDGINKKFYRVILKDGVEIDRESRKENVYKKAVDKVLVIGTKELGQVKEETLYFITNDIHLKEEPSTNSKTLVTIPKGSHLSHISTDGAWHKITYKEEVGYVDASLVKEASGYKVDDTLIVNKGYELSSDFNPGINPEALEAVNKMIKDAKEEGISLNVFSDFRSYDYQVGVYKQRVKKKGKENVEKYYSRPGYSEHQTGLAFDIGGSDSKYFTSKKFGQMKEGLWMAENSYKYGLILRYPKNKDGLTGFQYEPWHFRYVGVDLAKDIKDTKLSFDEYFGVVSPTY